MRQKIHFGFGRNSDRRLTGGRSSDSATMASVYWTELATDENTLLAFDPIRRIVPTTIARTTASMMAYSAISCPSSSHNLPHTFFMRNLVIIVNEADRGGLAQKQMPWRARFSNSIKVIALLTKRLQ
jgi:hypothetical protein